MRPSQTPTEKEYPALFAYFGDSALSVGDEYHSPRHNYDDYRSYSGREIGIDSVDTYLGKDGGQRGKTADNNANTSHIFFYPL